MSVSDRSFKFFKLQVSPLSFMFVSNKSFKFFLYQISPLTFTFVSDRSLSPLSFKDLSVTNYKLKGPI
jgi:hypothetical protein